MVSILENVNSVEAAKEELVGRLKSLSDQKLACTLRSFFREPVDCYGVSSARLRNLAKNFYQKIKDDWAISQKLKLAELLLQENKLEAGLLSFFILSYCHRDFSSFHFRIFRKWLKTGLVNNWALIDTLALEVLSPYFLNHLDELYMLEGWLKSRDIFLKRAALVSLIKPVRRGFSPQRVYQLIILAVNSAGMDENLTGKALGWLLRETGRKNSLSLEKFLIKNGQKFPRVTIRYALEKFSPEKRKYILEITKKNKEKKGGKYAN
jgi:3-methyladenine DNA glycosylase AlkD